MANHYPEVTGNDMYSLRCGIAHNGQFGHPKMGKFERVLFTMRDRSGIVVHRNMISGAYQLDVETFCADMIAAGRAWITKMTKDRNVQRNLNRLVAFRPDGMPPYIMGKPLVA
ncbi:hypothetical protein [Parasphingorhabdus sp.]|uniref:hypothetical protein n=1 Tax=Parasphingorhabdus sp. TaxID=2709688 RepID=UPI003A93E89C